ncbi:MAG: zinc-dependent alcohol dehydrogenase family protein [Chakrabartia sp.]
MKSWILKAGATSLDDLYMTDAPMPEAGPGEVLVRVRACSLNFRDQLVPQGLYMGGTTDRDIVPLSDGVGEVVALGAGVSRFALGDRVAGTFFQNWIDGPPRPDGGPALGAPPAKGMLTEFVALPEAGLVPLAASLSFEEASTLPCAGVTAWNALMEGPRPLQPGDSVLVLGTGGVSLLALQIAKAAGARVIATSSSDEKLARVQALGADHLINYRTTPNWGAEAARLAGGSGVDHVVEVGGAGTLAQSIQAVGYGGEIALIGVLTREGDTNPRALMFKGASLRGIFVGSRVMAERLNDFVDAHRIAPVVDRCFPLAEARAAYDYQASAALFGKVVITL